MTWQLAEIGDGLQLTVETDGVWLRGEGINVSDPRSLQSLTAKTRLGRLLPTLIPQLLELELAAVENGAIRINHTDFAALESKGIDSFDGIVLWSPFTIEIESTGWLGGVGFKYYYRFYYGSQVVHLERIGCFVRRGETIYRLDAQSFALVQAIDHFNELRPESKATSDAFIRFAEIKGLAEGVGAQIDRFLANERVLVPSQIGLDLIVEDAGRISFAPKIDGVPPEAMRQAFLASDDVDEIYALDQPDGGRLRVVLNETQREVLRRMQRVRHLSGADRAKVLRDPHSVFDGVAEAIDIDLGPRVTGIGDFPFVARPFLQRSVTGIFDDREGSTEEYKREKFSAGIRCTYSDGSVDNVVFSSREQMLELSRDARSAWRSGEGTVSFKDKSILVDQPFIQALDDLVERVTPAKLPDKEKPQDRRRYLLIYTNENELEYREGEGYESGQGDEVGLELPRSLKDETVLKEYQRAGVAWLQRSFLNNRHGCLLADDMGLGKTLQVLTFIAWLVEKGELSKGSPNPDAPPWNPILIVAPVILLENETWVNDMRNFFEAEGNVFVPTLVLHGSKLNDFRRRDVQGRETMIGEAVLDLERLRQYRVILTNYETVTNYQYSFAKMKNRWTVVITDEAQEYKTPNTKISHALKSLDPRFRIACTGTPVETRLLDVWNLFDFLQPGQLLGSASDFSKKYEARTIEKAHLNDPIILSQLKERLRYGRADAFVLRREKAELLDLPAKHDHILECVLSPKQREWHLDLVGRAHLGSEGNHPLSLLQQLMRVYQHPSLVPLYDPPEVVDAINLCPKLATVLHCLGDIRAKGERVLIFTRSLDMQQLLKKVINAEFGLDVDIINGATNRRGDTKSVGRTRKTIVNRFRASSGFNVLVLSPDVAGIGLTLVEANHVIHYGRWWNPAKESQATDRVYRIGQTREVHVYYPIATDPKKAFQTFDEKLDALIRRRRELAAEFLAPMPSEDHLEQELLNDILETPEGLGKSRDVNRLSRDDVRRLTWDRFEALIAVLEQKKGEKVLLTPLANDGGIDVIAVRDREIRLIQCKHTHWDATVDANVIAEVISAFDGYLSHHLKQYSHRFTLRPVLATNGNLTSEARAQAKEHDVQVLVETDLWRLIDSAQCTHGDIEMVNARRLASMHDVQVALQQILGR